MQAFTVSIFKKPLCREQASLSMFHLLLFLPKYSSEGSNLKQTDGLKEEGSSLYDNYF